MATLTQRTHVVEERTDRLETVFAAFMARTDASIARTDESIDRLERIIERREREGAHEREEHARERKESARVREAAARDREEMRRQAEQDREKWDRYWEESARERKEMNKRWGELANKWGTVVEDIVAPSVRRLAREVFHCGAQQFFATRVSRNRSDDLSREREFDALYVGTRAVLLNETRSSPRSTDVRDFAQFLQSGEFALYYPEYADLPVVPVFSSLSIPEDMVTNLTRRGIYALAMGDEAMQVINLEAVRSRRPARPA